MQRQLLSLQVQEESLLLELKTSRLTELASTNSNKITKPLSVLALNASIIIQQIQEQEQLLLPSYNLTRMVNQF